VILESKEYKESSICVGIKADIPKRRVWDYLRLCRAFNTKHFTIKLKPLALSSAGGMYSRQGMRTFSEGV
jgi:hypothetical protein